MSTEFARGLRNRPTDAERRLWMRLRGGQVNGLHFRRQVPLGPYVIDFACFAVRLAIEVDGGQHAESEGDAVRDAWLWGRGFRVLRFWNNEVLANTDGVMARILEVIEASPPPPHPSPIEGEGAGARRFEDSSSTAARGAGAGARASEESSPSPSMGEGRGGGDAPRKPKSN